MMKTSARNQFSGKIKSIKHGPVTSEITLVLENGELKLNGKVIPEEQVASILFLAAMSMGY